MIPAGARSLGAALGLLAALALPVQAFDLQAHRGGRGLKPENTLPAFAHALSLGVTTLELDLGLSADGELVLSHDTMLLPKLARLEGSFLAAPSVPLRQLTLAEIRSYDVGRLNPADRYAKGFPRQQPADGAQVPTLAQVFDLAQKSGNRSVRFNIETKLTPLAPTETASPEAFAAAAVGAIRQAGLAARATIQSFDWRSLQAAQRLAPEIATVYLTAEQNFLDNLERGRPGTSPWTAGFDIDAYQGSVPRLVKAAGGSAWSPFHRDLRDADLAEARALGLPVIVWTVNTPEEMRALLDRGVDGIITDYPDVLRMVLAERGIALPAATPVRP